MDNEKQTYAEETNIEQEVQESEKKELTPAQLATKNLNADFEEAIGNIKLLIKKGFDSLDVGKDILEGTEHPRALEVMATTIKVISGMNKDLIALHKSYYETNKGINEETKEVGQGDEKGMFIGSSADLQAFLRDNE